ncbi:MAG: flagellar assembly protein FliW [Nitrospinae bacterium]|nr:flagellar assembly protein FliW [Nitrospinota bacterium]
MKIASARLGDVTINPAEIITFPDGIIGFPDFKRYVELPFLESSPLTILQAVDAAELGFFLIDPYLFLADYTLTISDEDLAGMNAQGPDELVIKTIVTIPEDPYDMTANLQGPLIINAKSRLARQIVNNDKNYSTKHRIISSHPEPAPVAG